MLAPLKDKILHLKVFWERKATLKDKFVDLSDCHYGCYHSKKPTSSNIVFLRTLSVRSNFTARHCIGSNHQETVHLLVKW